MTTSEPGSAAMELVQELRRHAKTRESNPLLEKTPRILDTARQTMWDAANAIETLTRERDEAREALKPSHEFIEAIRKEFGFGYGEGHQLDDMLHLLVARNIVFNKLSAHELSELTQRTELAYPALVAGRITLDEFKAALAGGKQE